MFDHVWPKDSEKTERIKLFLTRLIVGVAALWVLIAIGQSADLALNGVPGSPSQHIPTEFNGPAEQAYFRGSSIMYLHAALFILAILACDIVIALTALRSLDRSIAGKASRFAANPKWRAGMQSIVLTMLLCCTAGLVAFAIHLYRNPHFPLF